MRGNPDVFAGRLSGLAQDFARIGRNRFKLVLKEGFDTTSLYPLANEGGVQARRLDFCRWSLPDIVLKAMEGENGSL